MYLKNQLIEEAEAFCDKQGISLSRLGTIVRNYGGFFERLRDGGECTLSTYEQFQKIFDDPAAWRHAKSIASSREKASRGGRRASCQ